MTGTLTVKGGDTLARTCRAAAAELERMDAANARVAAAIAARAHPPVRTGRLAASVTASSTGTEATVSSALPYAGYIEGRTGFLSHALDAGTPAALEHYAAAVNSALAGIRGV